MIVTFYVCGIFLQIAGVMTSRIFIDLIPNKNRNSVYSMIPTVVILLGIPQIIFFGWLIPFAGIAFALILCGTISSIGVILILKGFSKSFTQEDVDEQLLSAE
jgi:hypothetical protein